MTVQIKLRGKYRSANRSRYKGSEHPATPKKRRKINDKEKAKLPEQPKRTRVVSGKTGKGVMQDA